MPWEGGAGRGGQAEVYQGWMLMITVTISGSNQLPFGEQSLKGGREWVTSQNSYDIAVQLLR